MNEREKVQKAFFANGRLISWPVKRPKQLIVLEELLQDFRPGVTYQEALVNQMIQSRYDDFCLIRRLAVDWGFMRRSNAIYQVNPRHLWPSFRERFVRVAGQLRTKYESQSTVLALGCFGSVAAGKLWSHSDLDLLVVMDIPQPQAAYQRMDGVQVHIQLLTPELLQHGLDQAGLPFLQALSGVEIWRDQTGLLQATVARAQELLQVRLPEAQLRETMRAVSKLHLAEKFLSLDDDRDARLALANALQSLSMVQLLGRGQVPVRRVFAMDAPSVPAADLYEQLAELPFSHIPEQITVSHIPEQTTVSHIPEQTTVSHLLEQAWLQLRPRLPELARPLLTIISEAGSLAYPELEQVPTLRGQGLSERLLGELCQAGILVEIEVPHPYLGTQIKFALPMD